MACGLWTVKASISLEEFETRFGADANTTLSTNETKGLTDFLNTHLQEKSRLKRAKKWLWIFKYKSHEPRVASLKETIMTNTAEPNTLEHFSAYISEVVERLHKEVHVYLESLVDESPNLRKIFSDTKERAAFRIFLVYKYGKEFAPLSNCLKMLLKGYLVSIHS